jgi:cutinase
VVWVGSSTIDDALTLRVNSIDTMRLLLTLAVPCAALASIDTHPDVALPLAERIFLSGLDLPSIGDIVNSSLTALHQLVTTLETGQNVQNDLIPLLTTGNGNGTAQRNAVSCPDLAVIFARGTAEPGNMGFLVGPPFATALQNYINSTAANRSSTGTTSTKKVAIQGLDYAAPASGLLVGGSPTGARKLVRLANATNVVCPSTRLSLAGYSQGAEVVRSALDQLSSAANSSSASSSTLASISSVVLFGDPRNGSAIAGVDAAKVLVACHDGDVVCKGGQIILPPHLNYSSDAPAAAMFVMQRSGLGIVSGDAVLQGMGNVPTMDNPTGGLG